MITNLLSNLTSSLMKKATEMGKKIIIKKYSSGEYSPEEWDNAPSYVKQSYPRVKVVKATPKVPTTPAPVPYENQWINKIPMLPQITNAVGQVANKFNQLKPEVAKPIVDMAQKVIQPIQNAVKPFTPAPIVQKTF